MASFIKKLFRFRPVYIAFLAIFIGIPLPGSGVWTGALAAYLLGVRFRDFAIACVIGVLIAAAIVTAVTLGLLNGFAF